MITGKVWKYGESRIRLKSIKFVQKEDERYYVAFLEIWNKDTHHNSTLHHETKDTFIRICSPYSPIQSLFDDRIFVKQKGRDVTEHTVFWPDPLKKHLARMGLTV